MARVFDHQGEEVYPEDVLDAQELAEYYASKRNRGGSGRVVAPPTPRDEDVQTDPWQADLPKGPA